MILLIAVSVIFAEAAALPQYSEYGVPGRAPAPVFSPAPAPGFAPAPTPIFAPAPSPIFAPAPAPAPSQYSPYNTQGGSLSPEQIVPGSAPGSEFAPAPSPSLAPAPAPGFVPSPGLAPAPAPIFPQGPGLAPAPAPGFVPSPGLAPAPAPIFPQGPGLAPAPAPGVPVRPSEGGNISPVVEIPENTRLSVTDDRGQYSHGFSDVKEGTEVSEQGTLFSINDGWEYIIAKTGSFSFVTPEGKRVSMSYTADDKGFRITDQSIV